MDGEHLCCIIRSKKAHPGVEAKRQWLADRLKEGHIFRKLSAKAMVFIEYAPLATAWTPVLGDSYYYIYCLWVCGESKGKGYGRALMEYCLADARAKGKSGVCMLGAEKQKAWLELNENILMDRDGMELGYYRDLCADYGIRSCCDTEDFNRLLRGLGEDAVRTAELFPDEDESITMGGMPICLTAEG